MVKIPCPVCGEDIDVYPEEFFADTDGLVITICEACDMWWINVPGTLINDMDDLQMLLGGKFVEKK